jgi:predicted nuclease with TOPRIM domain
MRSPLDTLRLIGVGLAQELRKELEKERDEHAAAASRGDVLQQQAEQLSEEKRGLEQVRDKLSSENEQLRQRAEALADSAEALLSEKYATQKKVHTFSILCAHSSHQS